MVAPPSELAKGIPNMVTLGQQGKAKGYHQLRMRCTEKACRLRPNSAVLGLVCGDPTEEIHADDKEVDLMQEMLNNAELDEEAQEVAGEGDDGEVLGSNAGPIKKRDYVVDLWPYAHPIGYYESIFEHFGGADSGTTPTCAILSTTAHPASALASRNHRMETFVLTTRPSLHALAHATELAQSIRTYENFKSPETRKRLFASDASDNAFIRLGAGASTGFAVRHALCTFLAPGIATVCWGRVHKGTLFGRPCAPTPGWPSQLDTRR